MRCASLLFAILASTSVLALPVPGNNCIGSSFSPTACNSPNAGSVNLDPNIDLSPSINARNAEAQFGQDSATQYADDSNDDSQTNSEDESEGQYGSNAGTSSDEGDGGSGDNTIGSSFSPTANNSPGAGSVNVDPTVNVSPSVNAKREAEAGGNCIGSSFSPTACNSPGAGSVNVKPDVDVSPSVDVSGVTGDVSDIVGDVTGLVGKVLPREPVAEAEAGGNCIGSSFSPTACNSPGAGSVNVNPAIDVSPSINGGR